MAKKQVKHEASTPVAVDAQSAKPTPVGVRGPKGVPLTAVITVLAPENPKRPGSKAHAVFNEYITGMTVQQFIDAVGTPATPNMVYDAAHGFIEIQGYDPKKVEHVPRPPKAAKAPKKAKAPKSEEQAAADAAAVEEIIG